MQNNQTKTRGASRKNARPKEKTNGNKKPERPRKEPGVSIRSTGAAQASHPVRIGMQDLKTHRVSWLAGYTQVGDGTTGITDQVYFSPVGQGATYVVGGTAGAGLVPMLGADAAVGQTYVADVEKHFARKVVRAARVKLISLNPSTANACMVYVGPARGAASSGDSVSATGAGTAAPTLPNVLSMSGSKSCASYESVTLEMTPFIAGGSGAKQNEFAINRDGDDASTNWGAGTSDLTGIAPCAFVVAGTNATTALRGTRVHMVVCEQDLDLLDFVGGIAMPVPEALAVAAARKDFEAILAVVPSQYRDLYDKLRRLEGAKTLSK